MRARHATSALWLVAFVFINVDVACHSFKGNAMSQTQIQPGGSAIPAGDLVATDGSTIHGDGSVQNPLRTASSPSNNTYSSTSPQHARPGNAMGGNGFGGFHLQLAIGDSVDDSQVSGLALNDNGGSGAVGVQISGFLILTTSQWDTVTGESGGLNPGSTYYLSETIAGNITKFEPITSGKIRKQVGLALDATVLQIQIGSSIPIP